MAVIKVINSRASIGNAIKYITKKEKTDESLISGKDCRPNTAIDEMEVTKLQWQKTDGRQYKHYIQSFEIDSIEPKMAHEIAIEWAEKNFKGYEVIMATHKDKEHIHTHFIVNSVSFENGQKLHLSKRDLAKMKEESDLICERKGLSIIKEKGDEITAFSLKKYKALEKGFSGKERSYLLDTAKEVSEVLKKSISKEDFIRKMEENGYGVNWKDTRKYITFTTPEGKKVRNNNLEKTFKESEFSMEGIENEIQRNSERARVREQLAGFGTDKGTSGEIGTSTTIDTDIKVYGAITEQINRESEERDRRAEQNKRAEFTSKNERTGNYISKDIARTTKRHSEHER